VKLIRRSKTKLLFQLEPREGVLLMELLNLYPRVPSAHQPLSRSGRVPDQHENQRLLDEALAEQRAENKKHLQTWMADPLRVRKVESGFQLSLATSEVEWLLQVLNDLRVGSWVILGSPEEKLEKLTAENAPDFWAMEMAGHFQMELLGALEGGA
jgi:hypothetical protein